MRNNSIYRISFYPPYEAVRVVKSLKEWTPGIKDGQPVRVQSAVYVTFSL